MFEGNDSAQNIRYIMDDLNVLKTEFPEVVRQLLINGVISETCVVELWSGGDLVFVSNCMNLGAKFNRKGSNCPWCIIDSGKLGDTSKHYELRTMTRHLNMGHLPDSLDTGMHVTSVDLARDDSSCIIDEILIEGRRGELDSMDDGWTLVSTEQRVKGFPFRCPSDGCTFECSGMKVCLLYCEPKTHNPNSNSNPPGS
jgi:hypothetical protein